MWHPFLLSLPTVLLVPIFPLPCFSVWLGYVAPQAATSPRRLRSPLLHAVYRHTSGILELCFTSTESALMQYLSTDLKYTEKHLCFRFWVFFKWDRLAEITLSFYNWHKHLWVQGSLKIPILSRFLWLWKTGRLFRKKITMSYEVH